MIVEINELERKIAYLEKNIEDYKTRFTFEEQDPEILLMLTDELDYLQSQYDKLTKGGDI